MEQSDDGADADSEGSLSSVSVEVDSTDESDPDAGIAIGSLEGRQAAEQAKFVICHIEHLYEHRYQVPRDQFPHPPATLPHVMDIYKNQRLDLFRQELRVNPTTFDLLLSKIEDDPVFANNSQNDQMPVRDQLAILLYRFGHYGNAASLQKVASWSGYGKGTVLLATRRAMRAVLRKKFRQEAICIPTAEEKEEAKRWVEKHSCRAWRNGWCLVDGTLVPLFDRPYWYGQSYYDRKSNYSLNFQVWESLAFTFEVQLLISLTLDRIHAQPSHNRLELWFHRQHTRRNSMGKDALR
jgi:hypothetical protein